MKELPADLLSAYYDHAVTPAEKEVVEQQLESSAAVRRQLEDFERLSELLQELPHRAISSGFAAEVLHGIERQMLLPEPVAAKPRWWSSRRRWMAVAGLLSTAAILFVTVQWNPTPIATGRQEMESQSFHHTTPALKSTGENPALAPESNFASTTADRQGSRAMAPAATTAAVSSDRNMSDKASGQASDNVALLTRQPSKPAELDSESSPHPDKNSVSKSRVSKNSVQKESGADRVASNSRWGRDEVTSGPPRPSAQLAEGLADSEPTVGEWLETLAGQNDQVALVKVGVVDYAAGMQLVQVVLSENSIRQEPAAGPSGGEQAAMKNRGEATYIPPATGELQVLFVQAESERLAAVIESLQNQKDVVTVQMEPAVAAAGFGLLPRQQSLPESSPQDTNADASGAAVLARKSQAAPVTNPYSLGLQQPDDESSPQVARQMLLNIPREALTSQRRLSRNSGLTGSGRTELPALSRSYTLRKSPLATSQPPTSSSRQRRASGEMPIAEPATSGQAPAPAPVPSPSPATALAKSTAGTIVKSTASASRNNSRGNYPVQVIFVVEQQPTKKARVPAPAVQPVAEPADGDGAS